MFEVFCQPSRSPLKHAQMTNGSLGQLRYTRRGNSEMYSDFQITVQILIQIELLREGRQVKHSNLLSLLLKPLVYKFAVMRPQVVDNQKHLAAYIFDQPSQKSNQCLGVHRIPIDHETDLALIGDRGDQVDPLGFGWQSDRRFLAPAGVASAVVASVAQAVFVRPMNLAILLFFTFGDPRVLFLQTLLHLFGILLIGTPEGLLWSKPPAFQVFPDGRDGHAPTGSRRPTEHANTDNLGHAALLQLAPAVYRSNFFEGVIK
jgi:hypothetical protein